MSKHKTTVYVGLSGGVDSSVSAALLQQQGYIVVGVYIRTWQPDFIECTWRDERRDAMRVAAHLGIVFKELDLEEAYKKHVADYLIEEYKQGRTPNPDIMCNREIKFGAFADWAFADGADYIATGHYAVNHVVGGKYQLEVSKDTEKDQTYFLWTLTQKDLSRILFPVGKLHKQDVRVLAEKFKLPTATKKDSQGVCMLGQLDMKDFLQAYIHVAPGDVYDETGNKIGIHPGALLFTLGERHGFSITAKDKIGKAYFVIDKDIEHNRLIVSVDPEHTTQALLRKEFNLKSVNWIGDESSMHARFLARTRYRAPLQKCAILRKNDTQIVVVFDEPQITASAGQSVVFYTASVCLGGGIIT